MTALDERAALEARVRKLERELRELKEQVAINTRAMAGLIRERGGSGPR